MSFAAIQANCSNFSFCKGYVRAKLKRNTQHGIDSQEFRWYARVDSNHRPFAPEANALSS
jgi:hypothetical protein